MLLCPRTGAAAEAPVVAVFDLQARGVPLDKDTQERLTEYLVTRLAASRAFRVIPREAVKKRLLEQKVESYRACYDSACQIELGRELAAQKSLSFKVNAIAPDRCVVMATLHDLKQAVAEGGASVSGGCTVEALMGSIDGLVETLVRSMAPREPEPGVVMIETGGNPDPVPLPAGFDPRNFDALGYLAKAQALAREKAEDVVLVNFDVEGVFPDGRVDLTLSPDYRASYRFRSPARSRRDPALPANVEQEIECLVDVEVSAGKIEVHRTRSIEGCDEAPRPRWRCSLKQAWEGARRRGAPGGNVVAKVSWLWDGWYFDFGKSSLSVPDGCE
jgi:hypothetical protein